MDSESGLSFPIIDEALNLAMNKEDATALALLVVANEIRGLAEVLAQALKEKKGRR